MTNQDIQAILRRLNRGRVPKDIVIRAVAPLVDWGFVWGGTPKGHMLSGVQRQEFEFFFVRHESGEFVAAVSRMEARDLHWYVTKRHRGKRVLREPLRNTILPFIFATHTFCETQRGTVDADRCYGTESARLAVGVGFRKVAEDGRKHIYEISRSEVMPYVGLPPAPLEEAQVQRLKKEVQIRHREVEMLCDVLRVKYAGHFKSGKLDEAHERILDGYLYIEGIVDDVSWKVGAKRSGNEISPGLTTVNSCTKS